MADSARYLTAKLIDPVHAFDLGAPLGDPVLVGAGKSPADHVGGFSILQAESVEAMKRILQGHPHLRMPGNWIELHDFLPMPGAQM